MSELEDNELIANKINSLINDEDREFLLNKINSYKFITATMITQIIQQYLEGKYGIERINR